MKKENKFISFLKRITDSEEALKRLPTYFFLICVLLIVLIIKMGQIDNTLKRISDSISPYIEWEEEDSTTETQAEVVIPTEDSVNELLPSTEPESTTEIEENTTEPVNEPVSKAQTPEISTKAPPAPPPPTKNDNTVSKKTYVINKSSKKIHRSDCSFVSRMNESNKLVLKLSNDELSEYINNGYTFCSQCGG